MKTVEGDINGVDDWTRPDVFRKGPWPEGRAPQNDGREHNAAQEKTLNDGILSADGGMSSLDVDKKTSLHQLRILVFNSFDQAQGLWRSFENEAEYFAFQRYDWLKNWHEFIGACQDLTVCITVVERPFGSRLMLLPLGIERRGSVRCLVWLGGAITDYQGPLLAADAGDCLDARVFPELWKKIRDCLPPHDAVVLEKQPEFIGTQPNPFLHLPHFPNISNAHFTQLGDDFQEFLRVKRSDHWRSMERKKERRLEKLGTLFFRMATDTQDVQRILQEMMRQKSQGYHALGIPDIFADPGYRRFFAHMTAHHVKDGFVHLSALMLNERMLATHWGLVHRGRFYCYLPTYARDELSRFSPGNSLLRRLMEWSIGQRLDVFDFTIGDEAYKYHWCDRELRMFDCLRANNVRGWLYIAPLKLGRRAKRWILRSPLRRPARLLRARIGRWKSKYRRGIEKS